MMAIHCDLNVALEVAMAKRVSKTDSVNVHSLAVSSSIDSEYPPDISATGFSLITAQTDALNY